MVSIAKTVEKVESRRRSLYETVKDNVEVEMNVDSGDVVVSVNDQDLDDVILGVAGVNSSAAARHINSRRMRRQVGGLKRSSSVSDHRRSGSWSGTFVSV